MSAIKRLGDEAMNAGQHGRAVELYTQALDDIASLGEGQSIEDRRILLANRALAYMRWKDIYGALPDCELALTPEYTTPTSPKTITAKCHFRRAKIRLIMTLYEEALEDYRIFERLQQETRGRVTDTDREVLDKITKALRTPVSEKVELIRAVQTRGIILEETYRPNFPDDPTGELDGQLTFDDYARVELGRPQLDILFVLCIPNLESPWSPGKRFGVHTKMQECSTLSENIPDTLMALAQSFRDGADREWLQTIGPYTMARKVQIILITHRGRFLKIPMSTRVGDIWAGAKWPRENLIPFEDLRPTPRIRRHEIDGVCLNQGSHVDLYLVKNEDVENFIQIMHDGLSKINVSST